MHDWRSKIERKRTRGNQTPGNMKTLSCQATPMDRYFAKRSRSYKHKGYKNWFPYLKSGNTRVQVIF